MLLEVAEDDVWLDVFHQAMMTDHVVVLPPILIHVHYRLIVVRNDVGHDQLFVDVIHLIHLIKNEKF